MDIGAAKEREFFSVVRNVSIDRESHCSTDEARHAHIAPSVLKLFFSRSDSNWTRHVARQSRAGKPRALNCESDILFDDNAMLRFTSASPHVQHTFNSQRMALAAPLFDHPTKCIADRRSNVAVGLTVRSADSILRFLRFWTCPGQSAEAEFSRGSFCVLSSA